MTAPVLQANVAVILRELREATEDVAENRARYVDYLAALRQRGWPLGSLARAVGVSRQAIDQSLRGAPEVAYVSWTWPLPYPPPPPAPPAPRPPRVVVQVDQFRLARMRSLQPVAARVNGSTRSDDPARMAATRYVHLLQAEILRGVTPYALAKALGVSRLAITSRLARYGYRDPVPSMQGQEIRGHAVHEEPTCP